MNWPYIAIKEVAKVVTGKTPPTTDSENFGGDIPFVTPAELDIETYITSTPRTLTNKGATVANLIPKNTVMVCCIGSLGKISISGTNLATNQQINSVIFDESLVYHKYGFYALQRLKPQMELIAPSTTVAIINKTNFENLKIPFPPLEEQKRIAAILDKADAIRRKRQQAIQLADNLLRSVFLDMFGDPITNPKKWEMKPLKQLGTAITGSTPPSSLEGMWGDEIPFATPSDLTGRLKKTQRAVTEAGASKSKKCRKGSLLVCCIGTVGKVSISDKEITFNQQINAQEWNSSIDDNFGYMVFNLFPELVIKNTIQTTIPILKKSLFEEIKIYVPPLELQEQFSKLFLYVEKIKEKNNKAPFYDLLPSLIKATLKLAQSTQN